MYWYYYYHTGAGDDLGADRSSPQHLSPGLANIYISCYLYNLKALYLPILCYLYHAIYIYIYHAKVCHAISIIYQDLQSFTMLCVYTHIHIYIYIYTYTCVCIYIYIYNLPGLAKVSTASVRCTVSLQRHA